MDRKQIMTIDYFSMLIKWRKFIISVCLIVCCIAAVISLMLPHVFEASTVIFPPIEENQGIKLSGLLSSLPIMGGMMNGQLSQESNMFLAILNSRTMMWTIIDEFDLIKRYRAKNIEITEKALRKKMKVEIIDDGTIKISIKNGTGYFPTREDADSARIVASRMANFVVAELDRANKKYRNEKAHDYRAFIEKRYQQNIEDLKQAEESYRSFQKTYGAIDLPQQSLASIKTLSELKAQIITKEIESRYLEKVFDKKNNQYIKASTELSELNRKYQELEGRTIDSQLNQQVIIRNDVLIPFNQLPDFGLSYIRLYRELKLQETLLEFLLPQYEQAKIQEAKDTPTVQVLDSAVPPIKRILPKRATFVITIGFVAFLLCVFFVFLMEFITQTQNDREKSSQVKLWVNEIGRDWQSIRRFFVRR